MNNSKLTNVLRTFSKSEMKEFEKLVASPFFNKGRNYIPFLVELKKFYPKFDNMMLTPEYIHSKLYPGKKFNKQVIWNLTSGLLNMTEEFLIQIDMDKNKFERNCHAADELYERKLTRHYEHMLKKMEKDIDKLELGEILFASKIRLETRKINFFFLEDKQFLAQNLVVKKGEFSILYFLVLISNVISNMHYNSLLFNTSYNMNLPYELINNMKLDNVINYAKENNYEYSHIMEFYYCMIMTSLSPNDKTFFLRAKELFENYSQRFETSEKEALLAVLINYCIFRVNSGDDFFRKMLFEINILLLKEIDEMPKKEFGKVFFLQVLRNALSINKIDWAKKYIEKYVPNLKPAYQKSMRALGYAFLNFYLKDFKAVLENLKNVKFIDTRDKLHVRNLYMRTFYELDEIETVISQIDSSRHFLNKNRSIPQKTKSIYVIFLNLLSKLINIKVYNKIEDIDDLLKAVEENRELIFSSWLKEKIEEIKRN